MVVYNGSTFKDINEEQLQIIIDNWSLKSNQEISDLINIPSKRVSRIAHTIGLPNKKDVYTPKGIKVGHRVFKNITQEQVDYILNNPNKPCIDIEREIGVDSRRVSEIQLLGGAREHKYKPISFSDELLKDLENSFISSADLAKKYNVSPSAIGARRKDLGVKVDESIHKNIKLRITESVKKDLLNPYISHALLGLKYKVSETTIAHARNKLGVSIRRGVCRTTLESKVFDLLKDLDLVFEEQKRIGKYSLDFYLGQGYCLDAHGDYWHSKPDKQIVDSEKKDYLLNNGFKYLVIWESELENCESVKKKILNFMSGFAIQKCIE